MSTSLCCLVKHGWLYLYAISTGDCRFLTLESDHADDDDDDVDYDDDDVDDGGDGGGDDDGDDGGGDDGGGDVDDGGGDVDDGGGDVADGGGADAVKVQSTWCSRQHSSAVRWTSERSVECYSQKYCSTQTAGKQTTWIYFSGDITQYQ